MALGGTNYKLRCSMVTVFEFLTAPAAARVAGVMEIVGDVVGVYPISLATADVGDDVAFHYKAEKIIVPCAVMTSGNYTEGSKVYFDATNAEVTETALGNTLCGIVLLQPAVGDEEVMIELDGTLGIVA